MGGSYVTDRGFIGVAFGGYDTDYGIPGHHHHDHDEGETLKDGQASEPDRAGVHSELEQRRADLHSQLDDPFGGFSALRFSAGWRDYDHEEIEGEEVGTRFENQWSEARLDFVNDPHSGIRPAPWVYSTRPASLRPSVRRRSSNPPTPLK